MSLESQTAGNKTVEDKIIVHRAFKQRLYPTDDQARTLLQWCGVVRAVRNAAWEQRRDWWRHYKRVNGRSLNIAAQSREVSQLRVEFDWIAAVPRSCLEQALRDLDTIFSNFFAGRGGYPKPWRKGINDSLRVQGREVRVERLNKRWARLFFPKLGWLRFRWTRPLGIIRNVTVTPSASGWHASIACEVDTAPLPVDRPAIGIDRGVAHTLALSNGSFRDLPIDRLRLLDRRARKQSRILARRKKGSNRRDIAKRHFARTKAKIARVRKHWHHVESRRITERYDTVVIEKLETANMTASAKRSAEKSGNQIRQKAGLNRTILEQGWYQFETFLTYKMEAAGGCLIRVPAAYTSQTCAECGAVDPKSRKSQSRYKCTLCGHSDNADTNAAKVILIRGQADPAWRLPVAVPMKREPNGRSHDG